MAASHNLPHSFAFRKSGVLVLHGYGIKVYVNSGHLICHDGIAEDRRTIRIPRVGHGLRRLVCIGNDGFVTLEALRWLADQRAAFVMLERDGRVVTVTGPVRPSDSRLRRAQALAGQSETSLCIARELIDKKLAGQESVASYKLLAGDAAETIHRNRADLAEVDTIEQIRLVESRAAGCYWSAWRNLQINFPRKEHSRIPDHWRAFGARISPLTGSPRLAVGPVNAVLNYLYGLLEAESRLAAVALGLDPGLGVLHADMPTRDSLACDLMEPVRPMVDAFVLDWITRETLKREWFFEQRDGNCRLTSSLAVRLAETAPTWGRAVAPFTEWLAQTLWNSKRKRTDRSGNLPTRLTGRHRIESRGKEFSLDLKPAQHPSRICPGCGATTRRGLHCLKCGREISREKLIELAKVGRAVAQSPESRNKVAETQRLHGAAKRAWDSSPKPAWPDEHAYVREIQPRLSAVTISQLSFTLGVSESYAADIRAGKRTPHPRHWHVLAQLIGMPHDVVESADS
jgi:CRISPR-associated endonuclease Cas1